MKKALFLDRDGTIIHDVGYLSDPDRIEFFPEVLEKISKIKKSGLMFFMVTNQSGIGRGYFDESVLIKVHDRLDQLMLDEGAGFDGLRYCPHSPDDDCGCRKPSPEMVYSLADEFDIDLKASFFIGDKVQDVITGINSGCKTALILNDNPLDKFTSSKDWVEPDFIASTPADALDWVLENI